MQLILASQSQGRKQLLSLFKIPFKVIPSSVDEDKTIGKTPLETLQLRARLKGEDLTKKFSSPSSSLSPLSPLSPSLIISADSGAILDSKLIGKPKTKKEAIEILERFSGRTHEFITAMYIIKVSLRGAKKIDSLILKRGDTRGRAPDSAHEGALAGGINAGQDPLIKIMKIWNTYDRSFVTMKKLTPEDINLHIKLSEYTRYAGGYALFACPLCLAQTAQYDLDNQPKVKAYRKDVLYRCMHGRRASPVDLVAKVRGSLTNVVGLPLEKLIPILRENSLS